jgi:polysaccharide deacetylase 2 family uncharacterized protein YibQ
MRRIDGYSGQRQVRVNGQQAMRVLLYTATAFFIVLAGVFTFYGLQGPEHPGGAKVVLSIDSREAPGGATGSAEEPERDLYAEAAARLQSLEAAKEHGKPGGEDAAAADDADVNGDRLSAAPDEHDVRSGDRRAAASGGAAQTPGTQKHKGQSDEISALPPGAALAGLDHDKPLFKSIAPGEDVADSSRDLTATPVEGALPGTQLDSVLTSSDERTLASVSPNGEADPANARNQPAGDRSANSAGLRPRQDGAADGASETEGGQKPGLDAVLAALNEREGQGDAAASPPAGPPPPLPLRRSNAKSAAVNGWGSTKITKTDNAGTKPARVAILLRGLGRDDRNSSDAVTKLPPAISLAFMPFSGAAQPWAKKAAEQGHEIIVQLPLEPSDYPVNNPGPETLLASSAPDQNASRLGTILGRFEGYSGVTNFLGGRMLQSKSALRPILEEIKSRGLIYIGEGNNNSHALVRGLAGEIGLRYGGANVMIDAQPTPAAIQAALERLVAIARKDGSAIGLGYASRATIEQLEAWSQTLAAQGVTLVPVGTLAQPPGAS